MGGSVFCKISARNVENITKKQMLISAIFVFSFFRVSSQRELMFLKWLLVTIWLWIYD